MTLGILLFASRMGVTQNRISSTNFQSKSKFTESSVIMNIIAAVIGVYLIGLRTFLVMPIINSLLAIFNCERTAYTMWTSSSSSSNIKTVNIDMSSNFSCYSTEHYLLMLWAIILIAIIFLLLTLTISLFTDMQPDAKLPWANIRRQYEAIKLLKKILLFIPLQMELVHCIIYIYIYMYSFSIRTF